MASSDSNVRLQKFISSCGVASRRKAEEMILDGQVVVNGSVVTTLGVKVNPKKDEVLIGGVPIMPEQKRLYLFHKPRGVVSTLSDPQSRPCLGDYVERLAERVYPVGRLDFDVSGLMLLTNDGEFANRLAHPRYEVPRTYWVIIDGQPSKELFEKLLKGLKLEDGMAKAEQVSAVEDVKYVELMFGPIRAGHSVIEVVVSEGRKHFVKRLLYAVGSPVLRMARVGFGDFHLGNIAPGAVHELGLRQSKAFFA